MTTLNYDLVPLKSVRGYLNQILDKNELSSAASVRQSKYITKAIGSVEYAIESRVLKSPERRIIDELLLELKQAYQDCTTFIGKERKCLCDVVSGSGYEEELTDLRLSIQGNFLPEIRKMLNKRPFIITKTKRSKPTAKGKKKKVKSKTMKDRFTFARGQVLFDGKDFGIPAGPCTDIFSLLLKAMPKIVLFAELNKASDEPKRNTAQTQLRTRRSIILKQLKKHNLPLQIITKKGQGYSMEEGKLPRHRKSSKHK